MRGAFEFDSGRRWWNVYTRNCNTRPLAIWGGGWVGGGLRRGQRQYMMNSEEEDVFKDDEVDRLKLLVWGMLAQSATAASKSSQSLLREVVNNSLQVHRPSATSAMHANSRSKSYFGVGNNLDQNRSLIQNLHDRKKATPCPFLKDKVVDLFVKICYFSETKHLSHHL